MPPAVDTTVGDSERSINWVGEEVKDLSGQSFVHIANSLQYVGFGPFEYGSMSALWEEKKQCS